MQKVSIFLIGTLSFLFLNSCSVYTSSDRKKFETDTATAELQLQNSIETFCSEDSVSSFASSKKLVQVYNSPDNQEPVFLWQFIINNSTVFETDNLKGVYCLYE